MSETSVPFSPASARLAVEELFEAIPKSRRLDHIGALNEALVVLGKITDQETAV